MPHPAHGAAARRDGRLLRIRKLTLWITGGAAAASLGLGTAFAHALPGHMHPAAPGAPAPGARAPGARGAPVPGTRARGAPKTVRYGLTGRGAVGHGHGHQAALTRPQRQPRPAAPASAPVSSGGS
jgi:hypothetical protein